ncbi:AMP-binding protein [Hyunsoonleella pacifica]|uniref:O-succinylbenzoic acid--CoA ligase n=1 Tax=Hyunsoonleella pacifica TaxID=1080224 RepID=A0A4Q9FUS1_9FLAO|nr:AMP-binding protein [Hyunsoonleella pacifica]TBN17819.1 O-succinylbenzoic acid--CoA ligase [Hyunsoonleella pacifica]GGD08704.1 O-succinylbenzoic acid--CoA ligase [Hyunsoonleella pacifica]
MTPDYTKVHNRFMLEGYHYNREDLMDVAYSFVKEGYPYQRELGLFLLDWLDNKDYIKVKTSGSTGKPKKLKIKKQAMVNSAITSGDFFNLTPGKKVLNCLPSNFIAGKMMMVRAIILGLEVDMVVPSALPRIDYDKDYDFCAFTPMQLKNFAKYLKSIKTVIVGGGRVSNHIKDLIKNKKPQVYETYGMTETVSHIAVKKLNNFSGTESDNYFTTLPGVSISKDNRGCLVIEAPKLSEDKIITNDLVEIYSENQFEWIGRFDNMINTGGIKVFPEKIEEKLQDKMKGKQFFIYGIEDDTLGEKIVMVVEGTEHDLDATLFDVLDKYEKPKDVFFTRKFKETASGKIHRAKTMQSILKA